MQFHNIQELVAMGGYGWYVWPCYGLGLAVLAFNILMPLKRKNKIIKTLKHES